MTRLAFALCAAAAILGGCGREEERNRQILLSAVAELGKQDPTEKLPLCLVLMERRPLESHEWMFVDGPPPEGFEDFAKFEAQGAPHSLGLLEEALPPRFFIEADADALCYQFTRPFVRGDRAAVSLEMRDGRGFAGTTNYWMRRQGKRWVVARMTKGHQDI